MRADHYFRGQLENWQLCFSDEQALEFAKLNLAAVVLSMLYSLFDSRGTDLNQFVPTDPELASRLRGIRKEWMTIERSVTKIRHAYGFHGAKWSADTQDAIAAFAVLGDHGISVANAIVRRLFRLVGLIAGEASGNFELPQALRTDYHRVSCHYDEAKDIMERVLEETQMERQRELFSMAREYVAKGERQLIELKRVLPEHALLNERDLYERLEFWEKLFHAASEEIPGMERYVEILADARRLSDRLRELPGPVGS